MTINKIDTTVSKVCELTEQLSRSLRRPNGRTLRLLDRALGYLTPFESPRASVASPSERRDLLALLQVHCTVLSPYIDTDRVRDNLMRCL